MTRWEQLAAMADGWMDGEGKAPTAMALTHAEKLAEAAYMTFGVKLYAFPALPSGDSMDGGVFLEFGPEAGYMSNCDIEVSPKGEAVFSSDWTDDQLLCLALEFDEEGTELEVIGTRS